ncbi:MAG: hypothetical protein AB7G80_09095 [Dongiaceae bacterium]
MRILLSGLLLMGLIAIAANVEAKDFKAFEQLVQNNMRAVMGAVIAGTTDINTPIPRNDPSPNEFQVPSGHWELDTTDRDSINRRIPRDSVVNCKKTSPPPGQSRPAGGCDVYSCQIFSPGSDHGGGLYPTKHKFTWRFCEYSA